MWIQPFRGHKPRLHPSVYLGPDVTLIGDLTMEEHSSLWFGVIARADVAPIVIGADTNIQDGCILHNETGIPLRIGRGITVGHGAILHGCTIGDRCLIGMGAILLNGCVIGDGSTVAAGALVPERTIIPPNSMVMGIPGQIKRQIRADEHEHNRKNIETYKTLARQQLLCVRDLGAELLGQIELQA